MNTNGCVERIIAKRIDLGGEQYKQGVGAERVEAGLGWIHMRGFSEPS
jgi:hypothetical protein